MATLTKYHKTDTGKLAPCTATKRACKYGAAEHTFLSADQQLFMRDVLGVIDANADLNLDGEGLREDLARDVQPERQVVTAADVEAIVARRLADQAFTEAFGVDREDWAELIAEPLEKNFHLDGFSKYGAVSYDYDAYANPPGYDMTYDDGYGRGRVFTGLRVSVPEAEVLAQEYFNPKNPLALRAATAYVRANRLDEPAAYRVTASGGYYGQEAELEITTWAEAKIAAFAEFFPAPPVRNPIRQGGRGRGAKI